MKLNFRDLKQQKFTIDAEPSDTIAQVKEKIQAEKGWEVPQQKLIYSGKVLADSNTVESYNIEEKGFIVCMFSKPKAAPAPKAGSASTAAAAAPSTPAPSTVSAPTPAAPAPAPQSNPAAPSTPQAPSTPTPVQTAPAAPAAGEAGFNDPSAFLIGNRSDAAVREMEAMGFARPEIDRALRAAYFNPERAIEYLLSGIPENVQSEQRAPPAAAAGQGQGQADATSPAIAQAQPVADTTGGNEPINLFEAAAQAGQGRGGAARAGAGAGLGAGATGGAQQPVNMDFLRQSPHFQQLRQLVQQQPSMLEPILQQVAEGNPQLAQMIGQNQEQFLQLLAEDIGGEGGDGPLPPGATQVSVTEEERDAIERLCRLGFSRDQVIQAYFACDKNEELAANFLFEQPDDEEQ